MLAVFHQAGFEATSAFADGVIEVQLGLEPTPEAPAAIEDAGPAGRGPLGRAPAQPDVGGGDRRRAGAGRARPRGVPQPAGPRLHGPVYPVNPLGGHVASVPSYPTRARDPPTTSTWP